MRSIDKLREWADGLRGIWLDPNNHSIIVTTCDDMVPSMDCVSLREHVNGILDGIEQEVADMRGFCERLDDAATKREDVTLWGVDYTPVPVDADGVPIHVGDAMEADNGTTFEVEHISLYQWGWRCVGEGTDRSGVTCTAHAIPDGCRHHHAPTVEDVLQEFTDEVWNRCCEGATASDSGIDELVAEYAAKLRLAGDE